MNCWSLLWNPKYHPWKLTLSFHHESYYDPYPQLRASALSSQHQPLSISPPAHSISPPACCSSVCKCNTACDAKEQWMQTWKSHSIGGMSAAEKDAKDTLLISLNAASSNKIQLSDPFFFSSTRQFNMWPDISLATHWYYQDLQSNLVFYTFNIGLLTLSTLAYYPHICCHFFLLLLFSVLLRLWFLLLIFQLSICLLILLVLAHLDDDGDGDDDLGHHLLLAHLDDDGGDGDGDGDLGHHLLLAHQVAQVPLRLVKLRLLHPLVHKEMQIGFPKMLTLLKISSLSRQESVQN